MCGDFGEMLNLAGRLNAAIVQKVNELTSMMFRDRSKFADSESLILYQQGYFEVDELMQMCEEVHNPVIPLSLFKEMNIPSDLKAKLRDSVFVPYGYDYTSNKTLLATVYEYKDKQIPESIKGEHSIIIVPLFQYATQKVKLYGKWDELLPISGKHALDLIFEEAIAKKVADITIASREHHIVVYYNKDKVKVDSRFMFPKEMMDDIIKTLTISTPMFRTTESKSKRLGYTIDKDYRARVQVNKTMQGNVITMRIYTNQQFNATMESLNLHPKLYEFLNTKDYYKPNGLRLIVGETMSGKNTTALAILSNVLKDGNKKVVSIEMPVEQILEGVEQINCEEIEEYSKNISSLIHQNPDFIYLSEINDDVAKDVLRSANTGKRILTTLHSNSVSDTIPRLMDITGLTTDRIINLLHSIIYQKLVNVNGKVKVVNRFFEFKNEDKLKLYGKSLGFIIKYIQEREIGEEDNDLL